MSGWSRELAPASEVRSSAPPVYFAALTGLEVVGPQVTVPRELSGGAQGPRAPWRSPQPERDRSTEAASPET